MAQLAAVNQKKSRKHRARLYQRKPVNIGVKVSHYVGAEASQLRLI
jgi:hypothetical protein